MKKIIILTLCSLTLLSFSCNDNGKGGDELSHKDSLLINQLKVFQDQLRDAPFVLYPTKNMYNFLELNTATGQIWIVQWSIEDDKRFTYVLDDQVRISENEEPICGRFSLQPTENIYNFILLDNLTGRCWQAQWSFDKDKRFVTPIY